jgi:hypothetical protein
MIVAQIREGGVDVRLVCRVCGRAMVMSECWGMVPPGAEHEEIVWVHRPCVSDAELRRLFGTRRVVFLRGEDTLRRLIMTLCDDPIPPADSVRQRNTALVRAGVGVPDVQRASRKRMVQ